MKITIRDVAQKVGVSHTTVSLVLNNNPRISPETKALVLKVMKEMNFHPDEMARTLARGNSNVISVVSVMLVSPFISGVLEGIETQAYALNRYEYSIEPRSTRKSPEMKKSIFDRIFYGSKPAAIIGLGIGPSEALIKQFMEKKVPVTLVECRMKGANSIRVDNFTGAYKAVDYLAKKGRKKIGLISADITPLFDDVEIYNSAAERFAGYKQALADNGLIFDEKLVMPAHTFSYEEGKDAMVSYLAQGLNPDAVFCAAGDTTAMGAMEQALQRGVKVPDDIAFIGYDDLFYTRFVKPGLTTIRQPITQMGREAFDITIAAIDGKLTKEREVIFEPELIVRESA